MIRRRPTAFRYFLIQVHFRFEGHVERRRRTGTSGMLRYICDVYAGRVHFTILRLVWPEGEFLLTKCAVLLGSSLNAMGMDLVTARRSI